MPRIVSTPSILFLSLGLHLVLLLYAEHVDTHPEDYGGLKYTDVDWRVVMDGARLMFEPGESNRARGWFVEYFNLNVGE
jgi:phosphatidylinositol glycan class M